MGVRMQINDEGQATGKFNANTINTVNVFLKTDGTNTYTFDDRNHLSAISGGSTASFVYDGLGRRMSATAGGSTTQYLYDAGGPCISGWNW